MAGNEATARERLETLKKVTLALASQCSRPSSTESDLRKGMASVAIALAEMETLWQFLNPEKRHAYTKEGEGVQSRAFKHVRFLNPNLKTITDAIGTQVPVRNLVVTRSKKRRRDSEMSGLEMGEVHNQGATGSEVGQALQVEDGAETPQSTSNENDSAATAGSVDTVTQYVNTKTAPAGHQSTNISPNSNGNVSSETPLEQTRPKEKRSRHRSRSESRASSPSSSSRENRRQRGRSRSEDRADRGRKGNQATSSERSSPVRKNSKKKQKKTSRKNKDQEDPGFVSWAQSHYYPKERESKFVPPEQGKRFGELAFPPGWALPSAKQFRQYFDKVDILPMLGKFGAFGHFEGNVDSYPGWKDNFYRVVHVQAVPLIHKVNALDQAVSVEIKRKLFRDLDSSAENYVIRLKRLEKEYGGPGKHMANLIARLKAVGEIGRNYEKVRDAAFALERYIDSSYCKDPTDPLVVEIIKPMMKTEVKEMYRTFLLDKKRKDNPVSLHEFLTRMLEIKGDDRPPKHDKNREKKGKKKPKKVKSSEGEKKANYQFFRPPSTSDDTTSDSSSESDSFDSSSEDESNLNIQRREEICEFCKGLHNLFRCLKFFCELDYKDRRQWVVEEKRCPLCLKTGHKRSNCTNKRACRFCNGGHNSCIHVEKTKKTKQEGAAKKEVKSKEKPKPATINKSKVEGSESDEALVHSSRQAGERGRVSLMTFVTFLKNPDSGQVVPVNALADSGADHSILSARAARDLGLWKEGQGSNYYVKGHGGSRGCYNAQQLSVDLLDQDGREVRTLQLASYENPCGDLAIENWAELKNHWPHLAELPLPKPVGDGVVDLILGSSAIDLMEAVEPVAFGPAGGPVAKRSQLGWMVGGKTKPDQADHPFSDSIGRLNFSLGLRQDTKELREKFEYELDLLKEKHRVREAELKQNMLRFWGRHECCRSELRNARSPAVRTSEEIAAVKKFEDSRRRDEEGNLEVGLLWKTRARPANNYQSALRIFLNMEKRMREHSGLWAEFERNVQEWLAKKYANKLPISMHKQGFFIPTFMVVREDKTTTKYRLIVNGKFQFGDKCINDFLFSGPNVMNLLADVLLRFRFHKYVLTCDIAHMFLQVKVPGSDRPYLRFLFRDENGEMSIIEMCSHAFGLTQSPFVVINAVRGVAQENKELLPLAAQAVLNDSIVDDILTGCKTFSRLLELKREIVDLYGKINMYAHKWATNSPSLRSEISPELLASSVSLGSESDELFCSDDRGVPSIKCLGVLWHPEGDKLQFFGHEVPAQENWTMRKISSHASRLFDPLGLVSPVMLEGKLLLQRIWKLKLDWDDAVPLNISQQFEQWLKRVSEAHLCHIPRRVKASFRSSSDRLIIFTDASSQAYAAAAYLWCSGKDLCSASLWSSKHRICSLNRADSISRLELEGALLGTELGKQICSAMGWDSNLVLYFTDSTTVLWWLRAHRELDVFVGNRICRILDQSRLSQWFYVNTKENPADIPTRGMSGKKLAKSKLWWEGPAFLRCNPDDWPAQPEVVETRESFEGYRKEEKRVVENWLLITKVQDDQTKDPRSGWKDDFWAQLIGKYSDLKRGYRVAGLVFKFLGFVAKASFCTTISRSQLHVQLAVLRSVQQKEMKALLEAMGANKPVPKQYADLKPFLDSAGVIRVGGRLKQAWRLPFAVRCPVLLDGKTDYARQLLTHIHDNELRHCGGKRTLMNETRRSVWVTSLAWLARSVLKTCSWCQRSTRKSS